MPRIVRRLLLVVGSLVVTLSIAEIVCRTWLSRYASAQFDDQLHLTDDFYKLVPGSLRGFENRPHSSPEINSLGMRGRETPEAKPVGVKRVLILGDSVAFGIGVPPEKTLAVQLEGILKAQLPALDVEVLNGGVVGYNTEQQLDWLRDRGYALSPDAVIVAHCPNDVHQTPLVTKVGGHYRFIRPGEDRKLYLPFLVEHSALYRTLLVMIEISKAKKKGTYRPAAGIKFSTLINPDDQFAALVELVEELRQRSIPVLVCAYPYLHAPFKEYLSDDAAVHAALVATMQRLQSPFVDLLEAWRDTDYRIWLRANAPEDFVHPNAEGHHDAAKHIAEWIVGRRVLQGAAPP